MVVPLGANGVTAELAGEDTSPPVGAPAWSLPPVKQWRQLITFNQSFSAPFTPTAQPIPSLLCGVGGEG